MTLLFLCFLAFCDFWWSLLLIGCFCVFLSFLWVSFLLSFSHQIISKILLKCETGEPLFDFFLLLCLVISPFLAFFKFYLDIFFILKNWNSQFCKKNRQSQVSLFALYSLLNVYNISMFVLSYYNTKYRKKTKTKIFY